MPHFPSEYLLTTYAPLTPVDPAGILIHQSSKLFDLWEAFEKESGTIQSVPFWGIVWPGARMLIEYICNNPYLVHGKKVLDLGAGCGAVAVTAAKNGAESVTANDIDECALNIATRNATANEISITCTTEDLTKRHPNRQFDTVFVADMFYEKSVTDNFIRLFAQLSKTGASIFIADATRPFTPRENLQPLHTRSYPVDTSIEGGHDFRSVTLYLYSDANR